MDGAPCSSIEIDNDFWIIILEKAWAKVHDCYKIIEAGFANDVMGALTVAPSYDLDVDED